MINKCLVAANQVSLPLWITLHVPPSSAVGYSFGSSTGFVSLPHLDPPTFTRPGAARLFRLLKETETTPRQGEEALLGYKLNPQLLVHGNNQVGLLRGALGKALPVETVPAMPSMRIAQNGSSTLGWAPNQAANQHERKGIRRGKRKHHTLQYKADQRWQQGCLRLAHPGKTRHDTGRWSLRTLFLALRIRIRSCIPAPAPAAPNHQPPSHHIPFAHPLSPSVHPSATHAPWHHSRLGRHGEVGARISLPIAVGLSSVFSLQQSPIITRH